MLMILGLGRRLGFNGVEGVGDVGGVEGFGDVARNALKVTLGLVVVRVCWRVLCSGLCGC